MTSFLQFLSSLLPATEPKHDRDEAYLAEAVDICDLERRIHELDERGRQPAASPAAEMLSH